MNEADMARLNLRKGDRIILSTVADDGVDRKLGGLQVLPYAVPERCLVGYYPECNGLIPLWHYAKESKVPAAKSVPVRVELQHQAP
jgi:anaerobic selenocysteine-containing dehydrogenase